MENLFCLKSGDDSGSVDDCEDVSLSERGRGGSGEGSGHDVLGFWVGTNWADVETDLVTLA